MDHGRCAWFEPRVCAPKRVNTDVTVCDAAQWPE